MSVYGWLQLLVLVALVLGSTRLLGPYLARVYGDGAAPGDRFFLPLERQLYRLLGVDPEGRATLARLRPLAARVQRSLCRRALPAPAGARCAAAEPDGRRRRSATARVQHRRQLRLEHQLAELRRRVDDEPPHADERARRAELRLGGGRDRGCGRSRARPRPAAFGDDRQLLGRPDAVGHPRAAPTLRSSSPSCSRATEWSRTSAAATRDDRRRRSIPGGPVASQEAIKELGTNGGGIYNANSAHPFENPNGFTNLLEIVAAPDDSVRASVRLRSPRRRPSPGLGGVRSDVHALDRALPSRSPSAFEHAGQPERSTRAGGNMEGKEVRFGHGRLRPVRRVHHRHVDRRGQLRARQLHAARRRRAAREHDARRGHARAASARALRDADLRAPRVFIAGLMVGRTPEYLGKKIQAAEMKLVVLYLLIVPALVLGFVGGLRCPRLGEGVDPQPRAARAHGDRLRLHVGGEQQRLRVRRPHRQHRLVQHDARPRDARRPVPADRARARASPAPSARKQPVPATAGTFPTGTPLFAGLLSASSSSSSASRTSRSSPSGRSSST